MVFKLKRRAVRIGVFVLAGLALAGAARGGADRGVKLANAYMSVWINPEGGRITRLTSGEAVFTPAGDQMELDGQMLWDSLDDRMGGELATGRYALEKSDGKIVATLRTSDGRWEVAKTFGLRDGESTLRVRWSVKNTGDGAREVAPWLASRVMPGREYDRYCNWSCVKLETDKGGVNALASASLGTRAPGSLVPARPWLAVTDPLKKVSLVFSMEWAKVNWFSLARPGKVNAEGGLIPAEFIWGYVPVELASGETWQTGYALTVLRGLERVDWFYGSDAGRVGVMFLHNERYYSRGDTLMLYLSGDRALAGQRIAGHCTASRVGRKVGRLEFLEQAIDLGPERDARAYVQLGLKMSRDEQKALLASGKGVEYPVHLELPLGEAFDATISIDKDRKATITTKVLPRKVVTSGIKAPFTSRVANLAKSRCVYFPRKKWAPRKVRPVADTAKVSVWAQSSARKVWRTENIVLEGEGTAAKLSAPRGGRVSTSVVVKPKEDGVRWGKLSFTELAGPKGATISRENILVRRIGFLKVRSTSDLISGRFEDVGDILFDEDAMDLVANRHNPFYVTVKAPYGIPAGDYSAAGTLTDEHGEKLADVPLALIVYDVDLPEKTLLWNWIGIWRDVDKLAPQLMELRLEDSGRTTSVTPFFYDGQKWVEQLDKWGDYAQKLFDAGMQRYRIKTIWSYDSKVVWAKDYPAEKRQAMYDYVELPATREKWLAKWSEYAKKRDWLDRMYSYVVDEPTEGYFGIVRRQCALAHKYGIKTMTAIDGYWSDLEGYLDIWCPENKYAVTPRLDEIKRRGDQAIWYVCIGRYLQYPNINSDLDALDARIWLWQTYRYDFMGILYWSSTKFNPDAKRALTYADNYAPGRNGDGLLFYPNPEGGPWRNSVRIEILSEGVQEYDLLRLCEVKLGRESVMERLALRDIMGPRPWDYTKSPEALHETRERLLQVAEEVAGGR